MLRKYRLIFTIALILGSFAAVCAQKTARVPGRALPPPLSRSLPASDAVISVNLQKLLNTALPQLLGDSPQLASLNAQINDFKSKTGIDLRQFEQITIGLKYKPVSATEMDFEPMILASGNLNISAMMLLVKLSGGGKIREIQAGGKIIYVIPVAEIVSPQQDPTKSSTSDKGVEKLLRTFNGEIAIGAFNEKTLAIGSVARVQETFSGASAIDPELNSMVNAKRGAVAAFAGNVPQSLARLVGLDGDEFIKAKIDSMKSISGYLDINATGADVMIATKTFAPEQAQDILDMAISLQAMGKGLIGMIKASPQEKEAYSRLIENAKITRNGNQVQVNLLIPQNDLNILIKKLN